MPVARHPTPPPRHPDIERPLWKVTGQTFDTRYVPGQDPAESWTVYFETRNYVAGQVTLPASQYTPEAVAAAIEPLAENLERIHNLKSTQ